METRHCEGCKKLNTNTTLFGLDQYFQQRWDPAHSKQIVTDVLMGFRVYVLQKNPGEDHALPKAGSEEFCKACLTQKLSGVLDAF